MSKIQGERARIILGNVTSTVQASPAVRGFLRNEFKIENDIWLWREKKFLRWSYLVTEKGTFKTGIASGIVKVLRAHGVEVDIKDTRTVKDYDLDPVNIEKRIKRFPFTLRPYQQECLEIAIKKPRGIFELATGAGKTVVMAAIMNALDVPTLILTGDRGLAQQLRDEIGMFTDQEIGLIGDSQVILRKFTVALVGSVTAKAKKEVKDHLKTIRYLAIDEAHHVQAKQWIYACDTCENAVFRHGFTATVMTSKIQTIETKEDKEVYVKRQRDRTMLILPTGPVLKKVGIKDLVEQGWLSSPTIHRLPFFNNAKHDDLKGLSYHDGYQRYIVENDSRNRLIASLAADKANNGDLVLVFLTRIEHGDRILQLLTEDYGFTDDEVVFVEGKMSIPERQIHLERFKEGKVKILIGTSIIGEGLNFFCNVGINAGGGDSDIKAIQRLGRILRKKKTERGDVNPNIVNKVDYIDICDYGHRWFGAHTKSRIAIYKDAGFHPVEFIYSPPDIEEEGQIITSFDDL